MAYQMSIISPRAPYSRVPSDLGVENAPDAIQDPLVPRGDSQPQHQVPHFRFAYLKPFLRWLGTFAFTASIYGTLRNYEQKDNFSPKYKPIFNGITTALILGLGLNLFEGLKELAKIYRWKLWEVEGLTLREAELILSSESLLAVCKLFRESLRMPRKLKILLFCIFWLIINLGAQGLNAVIGLSYEVNDGTSYNDTYFTNGMVLAKNLTAYFNINESLSDEGNQAMAHSWGEGFQYAGNCGPYTDITDISNSKYDPPYFCRRTPGQQEFAYRFKEYNPNDTEKNYPYFTNRIITVSSGACFKYNVPNAEYPGSQCNDPQAFNYTFFNSTYTSSICIPIGNDGWSATIYIYRGTKTPVFDEANSCGDRCKWIWAYRAWGPFLEEPPAIFQCPITVSEVSNTTTDAQQIPDSVARVAAASIALQGRWTGTVEDMIWTQYQFNAFNTPLEVHGLPDERASANMAEFALRSLAAMVEGNPVISLPGKVPQLGSHLTIHKCFCLTILIVIMLGHLALAIIISFMTRSVVKIDPDYVEIARLLSEKDFASRE